MVHGEQPGLRLRLAHEARRIASQHAYLDEVESRTLRVLELHEAPAKSEALRDFQASLDAHFTLEEDVHFPALHGLDGSLTREIEALKLDHRQFREALERIAAQARACASSDQLAALLGAFRTLVAALHEHERREEALFARVTR